jgi:hypothetical protein
VGSATYVFSSWSDGRAQTHDIVAGSTAGTYTATFTQVTAPPGPVAAYGFEEGTGTTTADASGSGNQGSISGATWTTAGRFGRALTFDGSNDRININDSSSLDLTNAMTIEAWVYPTALSGWRTVLLKESTSGLAYALYAHDNAPRPAAYVRGGSVDQSITGVSQLPLNAWTHLAATFGASTLRLYVNGSLVRTGSVSGTIAASSLPLRIGGNAPWGEYFAGRIDEVRIYNRALSQAEIQGDMNRPVP